MCKITENIIRRVETAICLGESAENIVSFLKERGIEGYDAYLAYKAAEVSIKMFEKKF